MLSSQEQRDWDDIQRLWGEQIEEPPRPAPLLPSRKKRAPHDQSDLPVVVVAGAWITILLLLVGAVLAALTVAVVTARAWALWHDWPQRSGLGEQSPRRTTAQDRTTRGPAEQP